MNCSTSKVYDTAEGVLLDMLKGHRDTVYCLSYECTGKISQLVKNCFLLRGPGYSLIWLIRGLAAVQGMVFGRDALNRVYNFTRVCPKKGLSLSSVISVE